MLLLFLGFAVYSYYVAHPLGTALVIGAILLVVAFWAFYRPLKRAASRIKQNGSTKISYSQIELDPEVDTMTGLQFERYVASALKRQGYTHIKMTELYDWGVDIIARKDGITWGVQVKRCSGMVKAAAVRQVVTALRKYNCDRGMVVTNGVYSRPAVELARSNDCILIDRSALIEWA